MVASEWRCELSVINYGTLIETLHVGGREWGREDAESAG